VWLRWRGTPIGTGTRCRRSLSRIAGSTSVDANIVNEIMIVLKILYTGNVCDNRPHNAPNFHTRPRLAGALHVFGSVENSPTREIADCAWREPTQTGQRVSTFSSACHSIE